jgi:chromosome partitioning protein
MAARVVAFMNFKGGVGKTSSVVNLGACVARYHKSRVLIVDLDAQANSSLWLMTLDQWKEHTSKVSRTVTQIFSDYIKGTSVFDFDKAIVKGVPRRDLSLIPTLDLLPASVDLLKIEDRIHDSRQSNPHTFLRRALTPVLDSYDYIFLDCPPNVYSVTRNALFAADDIIVPYIPDFLSLSGVEVLAELVHEFYERVSAQLAGRRTPGITGFLVSHFMSRQNVFEQGVNDIEILCDVLIASGRIRKQARVLKPNIRRCVRVAEAAGYHLPVILHDVSSNGAIDYSAVAGDLLTLLKNIK